jgi:hypothetical protein
MDHRGELARPCRVQPDGGDPVLLGREQRVPAVRVSTHARQDCAHLRPVNTGREFPTSIGVRFPEITGQELPTPSVVLSLNGLVKPALSLSLSL